MDQESPNSNSNSKGKGKAMDKDGDEEDNWVAIVSGLELGKNSTVEQDLQGSSGDGMSNEILKFGLLTEWLCGELGGEEVSMSR